jgi:hypothetical protein
MKHAAMRSLVPAPATNSASKSANKSARKSASQPASRLASNTAKSSGGRKRGPRTRAKQAELQFRSWGGARAGAGRKPKGERAMLPHDTRPPHLARFPLLITTRLQPGLPSIRRPAEAARIRAAIASANLLAASSGTEKTRGTGQASGTGTASGAGTLSSSGKVSGAGEAIRAGAPPFQVVHHSIQSNHLHLIVEAQDRAALTTGLRGLLACIARALNRLWNRHGPVFGDRFHERVLLNPRQVRHALVYVLQNLRKHGIRVLGPDPYSSGPEFDGWTVTGTPGVGAQNHAAEVARPAQRAHECTVGGGRGSGHGNAGSAGSRRSAGGGSSTGGGRSGSSGSGSGARSASSGSGRSRYSTAATTSLTPSSSGSAMSWMRAARVEVPSPKTWLLGVGWRRHGTIDPAESPRSH